MIRKRVIRSPTFQFDIISEPKGDAYFTLSNVKSQVAGAIDVLTHALVYKNNACAR